MSGQIPRPKAGIGNILGVLRHRNYRLLWSGSTISNAGDWMDQIALNWLVLEMTGSAISLGLVNLARGVPILALTLIGGVAADRMDRRRQLLISQVAGMVLAVVLAVLVAWGEATLGVILAIAMARGATIAFNQPARHSLVPVLVPRESIGAAIALNSLSFNLTKVIGPVAAGLVIAWAGTAACFAVNALSFVPVLWFLGRMDVPPRLETATRESVLRSLIEGLRHLAMNRQIRLVVVVAVIPVFFGQPYLYVLALFAVEAFKVGPEGLGTLTASAAIGAMCGGLTLALVPALSRSGLTMLIVMMGFGLAICAFSWAPGAHWGAALLLFVGAGQVLCNATNNIILQSIVSDEFRGRIMSVLLLNKGFVQLGTAMVATGAALLDIRWAMFLSGLIVVLAALLILIIAPTIRRLRI